jgi:flagellar basal-body rod protein FlgG
MISNNLANASTNGYKKETPTFSLYKPKVDGGYPETVIRNSTYNKTINSTVKLENIYTDFSVGSIRETGNELDLALESKNTFFVVDTPYGIRFTRDGNFEIDNEGFLVNQDGFRVLGQNPENDQGIMIPEENFSITPNGEIFANGIMQDQIYIAEFDDTQNLQKVGRNLYTAVNTLPNDAGNPQIIQGAIEGSNINVMKEMVSMIDAQRGYETYQKVVQTMDELNQQAASTIGRLS